MTEAKLTPIEDGWQLKAGGVEYKAAEGAHVLGALVWALGLEGVFGSAAGQDGDHVLVFLARHWCTLMSKHGDEDDPECAEALHQALFEAAKLAPDPTASDAVYSGYFARMKRTLAGRDKAAMLAKLSAL